VKISDCWRRCSGRLKDVYNTELVEEAGICGRWWILGGMGDGG